MIGAKHPVTWWNQLSDWSDQRWVIQTYRSDEITWDDLWGTDNYLDAVARYDQERLEATSIRLVDRQGNTETVIQEQA